ncbi:MAG: HD domain-containing protein [Gemmataceae bacterium]
MHDYPAILAAVLDGYVLPVRGFHGVVHWARVLENGLRIAEITQADREVVTLFALFHDARRVKEDHDDGHGLRGAEFAHALRGELIHLDDSRFELLYEACRLHTDGHTTGDPTLLACWDADRLDLGRVGITPDPRRLGTKAARSLLPWAHVRAVEWYEPQEVLASWGVEQVAE